MRFRIRLAGAVIVGIFGVVAGGHAELYRCETASGGVIFTDDEAACPGAHPHESRGEVQSIDAPAPTPPRLPGKLAPTAASAESGQATVWRQRKQTLEQELVLLNEKKQYLDEHVTHCNRHRKLLREDETGLRYQVSCKNIRSEYAKVNQDLARVNEQLNGGLEEACRKAGCLPGWIR